MDERHAIGRERISCFVICQDEEAGIADCLESVRWCDELIVVDGGSRDRTVEHCRPYADRIYHNPWPGYVEQKRFGFARTSHPWVFNIDADERMTPELREEILAVLRDGPAHIHGYYVRRLVYYLGRWWHRGPWYPGWRLRLVRRARASWGGTDPHDLAIVRGRTRRLHAPLLHYTYRDISDHLASIDRLTEIASRTQHSRASSLGTVLRPAWRFAWTYTFAGGYREGFAGLFVCMTAAFYAFLRHAKRIERQLGGGASGSQNSRGEAVERPGAAR